jgi:hypothetical protein
LLGARRLGPGARGPGRAAPLAGEGRRRGGGTGGGTSGRRASVITRGLTPFCGRVRPWPQPQGP